MSTLCITILYALIVRHMDEKRLLFTFKLVGVTLATETALFAINPCENTSIVGNLDIA
ncbi:MAG: hypothetical protein NWE83_00965 [Candidatus Bathyarchaeota archaeon]|nr:hypothetical protein [Candidatus Bathyarchaeota archaeon]